jgi:serine/threonine protein kinase/formylglycine-generating enzyme required for sulfatase activity
VDNAVEREMIGSLAGKTLGKYQIHELLGRGAMAEVYKAYHPALDRFVAVKFLHSYLAEDKNFLTRLQREAQAAAQLRHPNIVQVHDFDVTDGVYYYIVMEHIDGETLDARLRAYADRGEVMPLAEAFRIAGAVASALSYAHTRDMIHRDIKPSNVMIARDDHVILTDFGIAKILSDAQHTSSGMVIGTPNYISPEQGLGKPADARSDIYSLGAMFFQMVTGHLPYVADSAVVVLLKHVNDPIPIAGRVNPSLPPEVNDLIFRSMAKNPDERYPSIDAFLTHLQQVEADVARARATYTRPTTAPLDQAATVFLPSVVASPSQATGLSGAVDLPPYVLSQGNVATDPSQLPGVCDADWDRAVDHFAKGFITRWLREGVSQLRAAHRHGLADELESIAARAEAIIRRIRANDPIARNAGLEEFLESLGAAAPTMRVTPARLDLPPVGIGLNGQPVALTIENTGRGYLFGSVVCRVPWLVAVTEVFGCKAGQVSQVVLAPDVTGLPAGRSQSPDGLEIRSIGGDHAIAVRIDILPSILQVSAARLDFGRVGQGEVVQQSLTIHNAGQGVLSGRARCREPWLAARPEWFDVMPGERIDVEVSIDSQGLPPGPASHDWALVLESNGGHAVLGVQLEVLSPRISVEPAAIDLGALDLVEPHAAKRAEFVVRNTGPGVLSGAVLNSLDVFAVDPAFFRCRSGESQRMLLSTARLRTGVYRHNLQVASNAGVADVSVRLRVAFSLEPEMIRVPAGWFLRGSDERDPDAQPVEKPQSRIHLSEYWMGKYPVTNAQYAVFVEATGHRYPDHWPEGGVPPGEENHPVVNVNWWDAAAYCRWLGEITGKSYHLPTEAQWEKAARGADGRLYPWGNHWDVRACNARVAGRRGTLPVGAFSPAGDSPFGCADVAGNVLEWTSDWYRKDYYSLSTAFEDPLGPASGVVKSLRGGSWSSESQGVRCAARYASNQKIANAEIGFRCAIFTLPARSEETSGG